ncbi:MAG: hypothetical protein ACKPGK_06030, partial [Verrucomicrobiota bacterium]
MKGVLSGKRRAGLGRVVSCLIAAIAAIALESAWADEARLLRFPALNGNRVVFTYAGDLYTVPVQGGVARRLTSDPK